MTQSNNKRPQITVYLLWAYGDGNDYKFGGIFDTKEDAEESLKLIENLELNIYRRIEIVPVSYYRHSEIPTIVNNIQNGK